jgi:hypothetical protein
MRTKRQYGVQCEKHRRYLDGDDILTRGMKDNRVYVHARNSWMPHGLELFLASVEETVAF